MLAVNQSKLYALLLLVGLSAASGLEGGEVRSPPLAVQVNFTGLEVVHQQRIVEDVTSQLRAALGIDIVVQGGGSKLIYITPRQQLSIVVKREGPIVRVRVACIDQQAAELGIEREIAVPLRDAGTAAARLSIASLSPIGIVTHADDSGLVVSFPLQERLVHHEYGLRLGSLVELSTAGRPLMQVQIANERFLKVVPLDSADWVVRSALPVSRVRRLTATTKQIQVRVVNTHGVAIPGIELTLRGADETETAMGKTDASGCAALTVQNLLFCELGYVIAQSDLHRVLQTAVIGRDSQVVVRMPSRADHIQLVRTENEIVDAIADATVQANRLTKRFEQAVRSGRRAAAESHFEQANSLNKAVILLEGRADRQARKYGSIRLRELGENAMNVREALGVPVMQASVQSMRRREARGRFTSALETCDVAALMQAQKDVLATFPPNSAEYELNAQRLDCIRQSRDEASAKVNEARDWLAQVQQSTVASNWTRVQENVAVILGSDDAGGECDLIGILVVSNALSNWVALASSEATNIAKEVNDERFLNESERDRMNQRLTELARIVEQDIPAMEQVIAAKEKQIAFFREASP